MSKQPRPLPRPLSFPLGDGVSAPVRALLHDPSLIALYIPTGFEGSTFATLIDYSGNGYDGTLVGATWGANKIVFDGDDEVTASVDLSTVDQITSIIGIRPSGGGFRGIMSHGDDGSSPYWACYCNDGGTVTIEIRGDTGANSRNSTTNILNNDITQTVCVGFDLQGDQATEVPFIYVNGMNETGNATASVSNSGNFEDSTLRLGNYVTDLFFVGDIYFSAVYSRILTPDEIFTLDQYARGLT